MNNGNAHRTLPLTWEEADSLFQRATKKGLAVAIFPVLEYNTGEYLAQNGLHYRFEVAYCYYMVSPEEARQYAEGKITPEELKTISTIS